MKITNDTGRAGWKRLYRCMRMYRARAIAWLHRAAGVERGYVADPVYLARQIMPVYFEDEGILRVFATQGCPVVRRFPGSSFYMTVPNDWRSRPRAERVRNLAWGLAAITSIAMGVNRTISLAIYWSLEMFDDRHRAMRFLENFIADGLVAP